MTGPIDLRAVVANLEEEISRASSQWFQWVMTGEDREEPSWAIEGCYIQILAALEGLGLTQLRADAHAEYSKTKNSKEGFVASDVLPNDEPYSLALGRIRQYVKALKAFLPIDEHTTVTKDILDIIRNIHYPITDKDVFASVPQNEKDVHLRIEAILKCVFPDLKHKPSLTKQIKNFIPDTGIPSLRTLIEYKFLSRKKDVGSIVDQLLADTRGYRSKDWEQFLYVIYETKRFRTESDWNQMMRDSGVPINTKVVVLSGEPKTKKKRKARKKA